MTYASKKEAQAALAKARAKAGKAYLAADAALSMSPQEDEGSLAFVARQNAEIEAARKYYNRCTDELEEAMHEYAKWDSEDDNA